MHLPQRTSGRARLRHLLLAGVAGLLLPSSLSAQTVINLTNLPAGGLAGDTVLDVSNGTLTCPWHGFCYDATSGECLSAPGAQLEQLPLRVDDGDVWVRVGQ